LCDSYLGRPTSSMIRFVVNCESGFTVILVKRESGFSAI
jgi:hypothetical protein